MSAEVIVGILGGGQLGRMLALAGTPLGLRFICVDPAASVPIASVAQHVQAEYDSPAALDALRHVNVVTYEFENVPTLAAAELMRQNVRVLPHADALAVAQDRCSEKQCFAQLGIHTAGYARIDSVSDLGPALAQLGVPMLLKTRRAGYDGKGQRLVNSLVEATSAYQELGCVPLIAEEFMRFTRELSILAVRSQTGEIAFYPLVQNEHHRGILRASTCPAPDTSGALQAEAERYAKTLLEHLGYVGLLALELFECAGVLYANEFAPRVHNSGHFSIEGSKTSQFENHLRAILGLPLGDTASRCPSVMLNLIGNACAAEEVLRIPDAHLHLYGKSARRSRKVGHITLLAENPTVLAERRAQLQLVVDACTDG